MSPVPPPVETGFFYERRRESGSVTSDLMASNEQGSQRVSLVGSPN